MSTTPYTRSKTVYFADGNIVLVAQSVAFRLYLGLLQVHSEVFRDMTKVASQPGGEVYDGCPVVQLFDNAEDLSHTLEAVCGSSDLGDMTVPALVGVLCLSNKYCMDLVGENALRVLLLTFPDTLNQWDALVSSVCQHNIPPVFSVDPHNIPSLIAQLEIHPNAHILLPSMYYQLAVSSSPIDILNAPNSMQYRGQQQLLVIFLESVQKTIIGCPSPAHCLTSTECEATRRKGSIISELIPEDTVTKPDSLKQLRYIEYLVVVLSDCLPCGSLLEAHVKSARQMVWDSLPRIYGFESWAVLRQPERGGRLDSLFRDVI
ncbi:hypothetical protein JB92DRAFT_3106672 [Gautieria morchelliformis]|nr:hypothetical protein JB92DRAFT_3106672 [Gautieria morchelliformis]